MRRLRRAWRQTRPRLASLSVAVVVIALGVALAAGMLLSTAALRDTFRESAGAMAGKADLQIQPRSGSGHFAASVLDRVRSTSGVAVAAPMLARNEAALDDPESTVLRVIGIDMLDDATVRLYERAPGKAAGIEDPLVFLNQPDSALVPATLARELGLGVGDVLAIHTPAGRTELTVRGIIGDGGVGRTFGGRLAVMDIFSVQDLFQAADRLSQIDLRVEEGADVDVIAARLAERLPVTLTVRTIAEERERLAESVRGFQQSMDATAYLAILLSILITANRLSMIYEGRAEEVGIMRAIGAPPRSLRTDLLIEAALLGGTACVIGLPLGIVVAQVIVAPVADTMVHQFKEAIAVPWVAVRPVPLILAGLSGIGSAVVAAYLPARRAVRESVRRVLADAPLRGRAQSRRFVPLARVVVIPVAAASFFLQVGLGYSALGGATLGALFVACLLSITPTLRLAGRLVAVALGGNARLGVRDLRLHERRAVGATATLVVGLLMVVQASALRSTISNHLIVKRIGQRQADLVIDQANGGGVSSDAILRFDAAAAEELRRIPGVARVGTEALARNRHTATGFLAIDEEWFLTDDFGGWHLEPGAVEGARRKASEGRGFFVTPQVLVFRDLEVGDVLRIDTPSGPLERPVLGVLSSSMEANRGDVTMSRGLFVEHWDEPTITHAFVRVEPGQSVETVRERIEERFAGRHDFRISNSKEFREWHLKIVDEGFGFVSIMVALVLFVIVVGTSDTLAALVVERRRQIGTMRAIGAAPAGIGAMVASQALVIGLAGGALGLVGGTLLSRSLVEGVFRHGAGWHVDFHFDPTIAAVGLAVGLGACLLGAVAPALRAARLQPSVALRYE